MCSHISLVAPSCKHGRYESSRQPNETSKIIETLFISLDKWCQQIVMSYTFIHVKQTKYTNYVRTDIFWHLTRCRESQRNLKCLQSPPGQQWRYSSLLEGVFVSRNNISVLHLCLWIMCVFYHCFRLTVFILCQNSLLKEAYRVLNSRTTNV